MLKNFEDMQRFGKDNVDASVKVWRHVSKSVQTMAAETADYSKKSFEEGSAALQKLLGAKSLENAIEIQTAYAKTAYEGFVAQATKMGALYADLTKETLEPFQNFVPQVPAPKPTENFVPQAPKAAAMKAPAAKSSAPMAPAAKSSAPKSPATKVPAAKSPATKSPATK